MRWSEARGKALKTEDKDVTFVKYGEESHI
jgi:hypothetical protein